MTTVKGRQHLREGDVVYFHCLHLSSARRVSERPIYRDIHLYQAEGKPRPVLVLGEVAEDRDGVKWFHVLELSTKISETKRRLGFVRIGPFVDPLKDSYANCNPKCYPENLVGGGIVRQLNPIELSSVCAVTGLKLRPGSTITETKNAVKGT